jgi:hypothetical protein
MKVGISARKNDRDLPDLFEEASVEAVLCLSSAKQSAEGKRQTINMDSMIAMLVGSIGKTKVSREILLEAVKPGSVEDISKPKPGHVFCKPIRSSLP